MLVSRGGFPGDEALHLGSIGDWLWLLALVLEKLSTPEDHAEAHET